MYVSLKGDFWRTTKRIGLHDIKGDLVDVRLPLVVAICEDILPLNVSFLHSRQYLIVDALICCQHPDYLPNIILRFLICNFQQVKKLLELLFVRRNRESWHLGSL